MKDLETAGLPIAVGPRAVLRPSETRGVAMGLPVTAKQEEVSGIPIPQAAGLLRGHRRRPHRARPRGLRGVAGKGTRATGHIGPFSLMGERKEQLTCKYTIQYDDWAEMPGCDDAGPEAEVVLSSLDARIINQTSWHAARCPELPPVGWLVPSPVSGPEQASEGPQPL